MHIVFKRPLATTHAVMLAVGLALPLAGAQEPKPLVDKKTQEVMPPTVTLRIDRRTVQGSGELRLKLVTPEKEVERAGDMSFVDRKGQRIELLGSRRVLDADWLHQDDAGRAEDRTEEFQLRYEQSFAPEGQTVDLNLQRRRDRRPLLVYIDVGSATRIVREIAEGFTIRQAPSGREAPDVKGAAARRYWLPVSVVTPDGEWTLRGNSQQVVRFRGQPYLVRVYRSLRRAPGTARNLPFEGEAFLLSVVVSIER